MAKPKKQYVVPLRSPEEKRKIRDWVGTHNGMSILKTDWVVDQEGFTITSFDIYVLGITNPKTEMLFLLSFPEAMEKEQFEDGQQDWEDHWTVTIKT